MTLKRSATMPFGPVTEVTPKRARTCLVSTPSPSIKMWLKRSASEPVSLCEETSRSVEQIGQGCSKSQVEDGSMTSHDTTQEDSGRVLDSKLEINAEDSNVRNEENVSVLKRRKLETVSDWTNGNKQVVERKSCKRKLTDIDQERSPKKQKRRNSKESENCNDENGIQTSKRQINKSPSPKKNDEVLKDLDSEMNKSPVKNYIKEDLSGSPVRLPIRNLSGSLYQSPTANLPNLVLDGPQTVHRPMVAMENNKKAVDWLTQMRIQKMSKANPEGKGVREKLSTKTEELPGNVSGPPASANAPKIKVPYNLLSVGFLSLGNFLESKTGCTDKTEFLIFL